MLTDKEQSLDNMIKEANTEKIKTVLVGFFSFTRNARIFNVLYGAKVR